MRTQIRLGRNSTVVLTHEETTTVEFLRGEQTPGDRLIVEVSLEELETLSRWVSLVLKFRGRS